MKKETTKFDDFHKDFMRKDLLNKERAQYFLDIAEDEGGFVFFKQCLLEVIKVQMGVQTLAHKLGIDRQAIYYGLSKKGSLSADRLHDILKHTGFQMRLSRAS